MELAAKILTWDLRYWLSDAFCIDVSCRIGDHTGCNYMSPSWCRPGSRPCVLGYIRRGREWFRGTRDGTQTRRVLEDELDHSNEITPSGWHTNVARKGLCLKRSEVHIKYLNVSDKSAWHMGQKSNVRYSGLLNLWNCEIVRLWDCEIVQIS